MESGLSVEDVPMDATKLKRGRKTKAKPLGSNEIEPQAEHPPSPSKEGENNSQGQNNEDEGSDGDKEGQYGLQRSYGFRRLISLGVDANFLQTNGLDLFHLRKVSEVARLF